MASNMEVTANTLNKQSGTADRGGSPAWGLGEVLRTPHPKTWHCYEMDTCDFGLD
jgi:hypothetical protein